MQLDVGHNALGSVFSQPDEGRAVAALGVRMAIKRVQGDIGLAAHEPLMVHAIPLQSRGPRPSPYEALSVLAPETLWIFD